MDYLIHIQTNNDSKNFKYMIKSVLRKLGCTKISVYEDTKYVNKDQLSLFDIDINLSTPFLQKNLN